MENGQEPNFTELIFQDDLNKFDQDHQVELNWDKDLYLNVFSIWLDATSNGKE